MNLVRTSAVLASLKLCQKLCLFTSLIDLIGLLFLFLLPLKAIPRDRHVVLLDMPGHGNSSRRLDYNYSFVNQASRVAQVK